jgi:hypothetical protein
VSLYLLAEGRSEKPWGRGKGRRAPKRGWMASGTGEDWRSCCSHAQGPNLGGSGRPAAPLRSTSPLVALLRVSAVLPRLTSCGAASRLGAHGPGGPWATRRARPGPAPTSSWAGPTSGPKRSQPGTDSEGTSGPEAAAGRAGGFPAPRPRALRGLRPLPAQARAGTPAGDPIFKHFPNRQAGCGCMMAHADTFYFDVSLAFVIA